MIVRSPQSCFKAPSVCIMKNLSKNKINRVRVPIVNRTKIANGIFEFHSPFTVSRVTDIQIGRSWW